MPGVSVVSIEAAISHVLTHGIAAYVQVDPIGAPSTQREKIVEMITPWRSSGAIIEISGSIGRLVNAGLRPGSELLPSDAANGWPAVPVQAEASAGAIGYVRIRVRGDLDARRP
jgi:hypothetical protein